ncbi:MAG TPA: hypothetical protein VK249_16895 [Anaerolineales bacterium]|nr:hypothetical protein [Anaerolineales bacterium]
MSLISSGQRVFFAVICAAALLVAVLGLFNPTYLAAMFTWLVLPPLHARFVGAIYAFGAVFMAGCLAAHYQAEVRGAVQLIGIWTGMLLIISLLNLGAFDFSRLPVWVWFASYITYPIVSIWMTLRQPQLMEAGDLPGTELANLAKSFLLAQGILFSVLAVVLFFAPTFMSTLWPWKVTPVLAQMYAGPLLSYGLGSLLFSRQQKWLGVRAILPGMLVFTAATVVISFLHIGLFSFAEIADLLWFGWFITASVILALLTFRAWQERG